MAEALKHSRFFILWDGMVHYRSQMHFSCFPLTRTLSHSFFLTDGKKERRKETWPVIAHMKGTFTLFFLQETKAVMWKLALQHSPYASIRFYLIIFNRFILFFASVRHKKLILRSEQTGKSWKHLFEVQMHKDDNTLGWLYDLYVYHVF